MKKSFFGFILGLSVLILGFISGFVSCTVGLGAAVDVKTPELTISYPETGTIIHDKFALSGTFSDDGKIESITVKIRSTEESRASIQREYPIKYIDEVNQKWLCEIDPADVKNLLVDGSYEATVEITDTANHSNSKSRTFTIDNTPPVIALTRPSAISPSSKESNAYDSYGQDFIISGHAGDACDSKYMTVTIFDMDGNEKYTSPEKIKIDSDFSVTIASYGAKAGTAEKAAYDAIYGTDPNADTQKFLCAITGYDSAETVPLDGSAPAAANKTGNTTSFFYMYEGDLYNDIFYPYGTNNAYKILSGTFGEAEARAVGDVEMNAETAKAKLNDSQYQISRGFFSLNPRNNPSYIVSGRNPLNLDGQDFNDKSENELSDGSKIVVEVSPGLDGTPLSEDTLGLYLIECNDNGTPKNPENKITIIPQLKNANGEQLIQDEQVITAREACISKSGSVCKLTETISSKTVSGVSTGKVYIVGVYGCDSKKIDVKNLNAEYGFKLISVGSAPKITIQKPEGSLIYVKKNGQIELQGYAEVNSEIPEVKIELITKDANDKEVIKPLKAYENAEAYIAQEGGDANITLPGPATKGKGKFKYIIDTSTLAVFDKTASSEYDIKITASAGGNTVDVIKTVMYDVLEPNIIFLSEPKFAKYEGTDNLTESYGPNDFGYLNGTVQFRVSMSDANTAVNTTPGDIQTPIVEYIQNGEVKSTFTAFTNPAGQNFEIDTTTLDPGLVEIKVTCADLAGNLASKSIYRYVDQSTDNPVIQGTNTSTVEYHNIQNLLDGKAGTGGRAPSGKNIIVANSTFVLNFIDDDGIKSLKKRYVEANSQNDEAAKITALASTDWEDVDVSVGSTMTQFSEMLSNAGKYYFYQFKVKDIYDVEKEYGPIVVLVSAQNPVLTYVSGDGYATTNSANLSPDARIKITTRLNISSQSSPFKVYRQVVAAGSEPDSEAWGSPVEPNLNSNEYEDEYTPAQGAGQWDICYKVQDDNTHDSNVVRNANVIIDNTRPQIAITDPADDNDKKGTDAISETNYRFKGSFTESYIDTFWYKILPVSSAAPTVPTSGTWEAANWQKGVSTEKDSNNNTVWNFAYQFTKGTDEGTKKLYICAVDKAGNVSQIKSVEFDVDMDVPVITTKIGNGEANSKENASQAITDNTDFVFKYKATDSNGNSLQSETVTIKKDDVELAETAYTISGPDASDDNYKTITINDITDGVYEYTIKAKDNVNKEKTIERTVNLDTSAPVLDITSPDLTQWQQGTDATNGTTIEIRGTAIDSTGVSGVWYKFKPSSVPTKPAAGTVMTDEGWTKATGSVNWTINVTATDGEKPKLYICAIDKNGLVSDIKSETVMVDTAAPEITITAVDKIEKKGSFTLGGTVSDGNTVKVLVFVKKNGDAVSFDEQPEATILGTNWTYAPDLKTDGTDDGTYEYTFTAKDEAGKTTLVTQKIIFDNIAPKAMHFADNSGKDIYFRIGDADNLLNELQTWANADASVASITAKDTSLDYDVGGKYKFGTYGNDVSVKVRGNFEETGSGVETIYYKVCTDESEITLFKANPENEKTGTLPPLASPETKRVKKNTGENEYVFEEIASTFKGIISTGFQEGSNYLVFVAVDKAGNKGVDELKLSDGTNTWNSNDDSGKEYYSINIDTVKPTITSNYNETILYTNGTGKNIIIDGVSEDANAGIGSIVFEINEKEYKADSTVATVTLVPANKDDTRTSTTNLKDKTISGLGKTKWYWKISIPASEIVSKKDGSTITSGNVTVNATVTDNAGTGNIQKTPVAVVTVDKTPPTVNLSNIQDADADQAGTQVNKTFALQGTARDGNALKEDSDGAKTLKLYYTTIADTDGITTIKTGETIPTKITIDDSETPDAATKWVEFATTTHDSNWTFNVDTTTIEPGLTQKTVHFIVEALDQAGNKGYSVPKTVIIDQNTDRPVITLTQLAKNTPTTLRIKNVYGSVQDDDGNVDGNVAKMWYTTTAPTAAPVKDQETANGWTEITVNGGSWSVDSTENDGDTTWYFAVQDKAGNIFWNAAANTTNGLATSSQPYFKCSDTGTTKNSLNGIAFKYDTTPPSATKLELARYETGTTKTVEEIYTADTNGNDDDNIVWSTTNNMAFGGNYNVLYAKIEVTESTGMKAFSGTTGSAPTSSPVLISYKNTNGTTYTYKKEQIKEVHAENSTIYTYYLGPITMDTNEAHEFKVTVEDAVGNKGYISRNIIVDNTAPTEVSNVKPNALGEQNGPFTYRGDANDNSDGSGVVKVEWCIPNTDQENTSASGLTWRQAPLSSQWEIDFSGDFNMSELIGYSTSGNDVDVNEKFRGYETDTTTHSGVYLVPVWFRLTDEVGNQGYDTVNGKIRYNPNTDRPSVMIGSPVHNKTATIDGNTINYVIMGGATARISGSADDDEGISKVYLQFDMDGDGKWDTGVAGLTADLTATTLTGATKIDGTPWELSDISEIAFTKNGTKHSFGYGIEVGTTKNWAYTLNLSSTVLPKITETNTGTEESPDYSYSGNTIKVRAISIDNDTENGQLASAWSETLNISVSNDIPIFNNLKLKQFSNGKTISEIDYTPGMYLTGTGWYLTGDVQANGGISEASYGSETNAKGRFTQKQGSQNQFDMKIPVELGDQTSWNVTIRVVDDSQNKNPNTQQIQLFVDNTPPSFAETVSGETVKHYMNAYGSKGAELSSTTKLYDIDGYASLWGKVIDNGSGFDKAVFYFKRKDANGSNPRIYNLMAKNVQTNLNTTQQTVGKVYIDTTVDTGDPENNGDNLPALYVKDDENKMGVTRPDEYRITVTPKVTGLTGVQGNTNIRVGGLVKIGGLYRTITEVSGNTVTFTPACDKDFKEAWFIYGMVVDSSGETKTGNNLTETDNDGLLENFQTINGTTTWNAALPTGNIPDGPIELHVVVFDAAGNFKHGYTTTGIENNPLRITKVMLGTNFNGNTTYDYPAEFETFYATTNSNGSKVLTQGKAFWNLDTKTALGGSNYFTVKNGLAVVPEFVGGTGDVYYVFEKTDENIDENNVNPKTLTASNDNKLTNDKVSGTISVEETGNNIGQLVIDNETIGTSGENNMKHFNFSFWDSTEGSTPGQNSSWTILNAQIYQDLVDDTAPNIVIEPFRWAGEGSAADGADNTTEVVRKFKYSTVKGNKGYAYTFFYTNPECTTRVNENTTADTYVYTKETVSINSLYNYLSANGHIDLSDNLPTDKFTTSTTSNGTEVATTGEYDRDPKVSGKITFSGTAYDNVGLSSLWFSFDGFTPTNYYSTTDKYGDSTTPGKKADVVVATYEENSSTVEVKKDFYQAAYYDPANGWQLASAAITDGWSFTVSEDEGEGYFNQNGHRVRWTLSIDTSKISGTAGTDKKLYMLAVDHNAEDTSATKKVSAFTTTATNSLLTADEGTNNVSSYQVDVVPYITGLTRVSPKTHRSKKGKYQVVLNESATISGFNLPGRTANAIKLQVSGQQNLTAGTVKTNITAAAGSDKNSMTFTVPATSGYIRVETSGVTSLNNINSGNPMVNPDYAGDAWTDDVYLSVWKNDEYFYFSNDPISPSMDRVPNGKGQYRLYGGWGTQGSKVYASYPYTNETSSGSAGDSSYKPSGTGNAPGPNNGGGDESTSCLGDTGYGDPVSYYDVITDASGNRYNVIVDCWQGQTTGWGRNFMINKNGYATLNSNSKDFDNSNSARMKQVIERMGAGGTSPDEANSSDGFDEIFNQFLNPRITVTSNGRAYITYYDRYAKCLKWAMTKPLTTTNYLSMKYSTEGIWESNAQGTNATYKTNAQDSNNKSAYYKNGGFVVAGYDTLQSNGSQTSLNVGMWSDIAIDTTADKPVIAYYDSTNRQLMIATSANETYPVNTNSPVLTDTTTPTVEGNAWTRQVVTGSAALSLGEYVSLALDGGNNIHIACKGAKEGALYYVYGARTAYGTYTWTTVCVDDNGSPGNWTDIKLTNSSSSGAAAGPVISYYDPTNDATEDALKVAYLESTTSNAAENWDAMTVPCNSAAISNRITLALDVTDGVTYTANGTTNNSKLAIGYVSSRFDCVYLRKE